MASVPTTMIDAPETVFTWGAPPLVFGRGALEEVGHHAAALGLRRVAIVTDRVLAGLELPDRVARLLDAAGIDLERIRGRPHRTHGQLVARCRGLGQGRTA